jgi:uncharacterized protein (DUF2062 family)
MKLIMIRKIKYNCLKLLRIKQSDHQIVIGLLTGFFHCWFPTFGLGLFISIGLAKLLRGNIVGAIIAGTIGTFVWPFLFYLNYLVGSIVMKLFSFSSLNLNKVIDTPIKDLDYSQSAHHFNRLGNMSFSFIEGSIINSILFSIVAYFPLRFILKRYRSPLLRMLRRT